MASSVACRDMISDTSWKSSLASTTSFRYSSYLHSACHCTDLFPLHQAARMQIAVDACGHGHFSCSRKNP